MGFAGFTDRELQVIALRANGVRPAEVARRLGFKVQQAYDLTHDVYLKTGFRNVGELTEWAKANGLD
jgi:DNA-binding CsgD family transcriptional regulator